MHKERIRQKGQAVLEFAVCAQVLVVLVTGLLLLFYLLYSKALVNYQLQRASLCLLKFKSKPSTCKQQTLLLLKRNLWLHKNQTLKISHSSNAKTIFFKAEVGGTTANYKKSIRVIR